jgi:hypothetical protein
VRLPSHHHVPAQVGEHLVNLKRDTSDVNGTMSSVDGRLGMVESDAERAIQGIDLLYRLLSSSQNVVSANTGDAVRGQQTACGQQRAEVHAEYAAPAKETS